MHWLTIGQHLSWRYRQYCTGLVFDNLSFSFIGWKVVRKIIGYHEIKKDLFKNFMLLNKLLLLNSNWLEYNCKFCNNKWAYLTKSDLLRVCCFTCQNHRRISLFTLTAWKVSKYGIFSGPHFLAFGLNTERYSVSLRIQFKCGKYRPEKTPYFNTLYVVAIWYSLSILSLSTDKFT